MEAFPVLAQDLHFGRAAQRRGVSQQLISRLIQGMERRIGGVLVERTSRRVALADLGRTPHADLLPHHRRVRDGLARAAATARGTTGHPAGRGDRAAVDEPARAGLGHLVRAPPRSRRPDQRVPRR
ncbi:helix-turn-helix domain-containing protein [Streptomyces sp. NBC_01235]|uniref:helix-turn-helix domain-containing protein n=1 Tax=Streptomyces sp. NBC_01235 TaxID=2903788 RepID=UPI003FA36255